MKDENAVEPRPDQIQEFLATDGPVMMVNLLEFRAKAAYPGGRFVFGAQVEGLLLGDVESLRELGNSALAQPAYRDG